jgi:hypothetical protein
MLFKNLRKKRPCGIPRHRWENVINMDMEEIGCHVHGNKTQGLSLVAKQLGAFREGLCSLELVIMKCIVDLCCI